jgi:phosphoenolpyruvate-protein kinase (PTS system EI component)
METVPSTLKDKWGTTAMTHTVEFFHSRVRQLVAERLAASGKSWEEAVVDPALELTREDFEALEAELLATGYRFEMSAHVSMEEAPDKYRAPVGVADSGQQETDEQGRTVVGTGQNVFRAAQDVVGTARFVGTVETVMEMLTEGVPPETIAIIDDSGGTLTAPILEEFAGVVCMGGTVRSHLGILTREYNVPCLMDAELDGLKEGDRLQVEYTKPAVDVYAERDEAARARIWRLPA